VPKDNSAALPPVRTWRSHNHRYRLRHGSDILAHCLSRFSRPKRSKGHRAWIERPFMNCEAELRRYFVESQPGKGSTFRILLPEIDMPQVRRAEIPSAGIPDRRHRNRSVDGRRRCCPPRRRPPMEKCGYKVMSASSGVQALEMGNLHTETIDLLLTEYRDAGINGRALARQFCSSIPSRLSCICRPCRRCHFRARHAGRRAHLY